jgi:hypothetical protein
MTEKASTTNNVSLIIDYGGGVQKRFDAVPPRREMSPLYVLETAGSIGPGLEFVFEKSFVDRANRDVGKIVSIDGVQATEPGQEWMVWINDEEQGSELRIAVEAPAPSDPLVGAGDVLTLKLA